MARKRRDKARESKSPKGGFQNRTRILMGFASRCGLLPDRGKMPSVYALADAVAAANQISTIGDKRERFETVVDWIAGKKPIQPKAPERRNTVDFYRSWEWRTLRMEVLKQHGFACQCCGATKSDRSASGDPVRICVDHIKPLSKYWELRLDRDNLQVLCDECNQGKGAWDETDHRAPRNLQ